MTIEKIIKNTYNITSNLFIDVVEENIDFSKTYYYDKNLILLKKINKLKNKKVKYKYKFNEETIMFRIYDTAKMVIIHDNFMRKTNCYDEKEFQKHFPNYKIHLMKK